MPKEKSRVKISKIGFSYYHDLDPYTTYPTKKKATEARRELKNAYGDLRSRKSRVATFYTILQDPRKNDPEKFGSVPQGPHTFPHHAIHRGLIAARRANDLDSFAALISSPADYNQRVNMEIPVGHTKRKRAELAMEIFQKRHVRFEDLQKKGTQRTVPETIRYAHVMNKLMQQDPYGTYAYKGSGASKRALKNKGESSNKPLAQQIDQTGKNGFNNPNGMQARNQPLLNLFTTPKYGMK